MKLQKANDSSIEEDGMASYGIHPALHERLVRCHNPARFAPSNQCDGIARTEANVRESMNRHVAFDEQEATAFPA